MATLRDGQLEQLASPGGGLIGHSGLLFKTVDPPLHVYFADLGDLNVVLPPSTGRERIDQSSFPVGIGVAADPEEARNAALGEAVERYAAYAWCDEQFVVATRAELGADALNLRSLPRCSEHERRHPRCMWRPPKDDMLMRWTLGASLLSGRRVWLPAVLVYQGLAPSIGEQFTIQGSTGCACHPRVTRALLNGLCEVVERDAVALTWLLRLRLPRIEFDDVPQWLAPYLRPPCGAPIERFFFDATTDVGVSTVYGVETARYATRAATLVACAADVHPARAIVKVIADLASHRPAAELPRELPPDPWEFTKAAQGCAYMARPEHASAFEFLLKSPARRRLSEMPAAPESYTEMEQFDWVISRLAAIGAEPYAVELSPDEALRANVCVTRVIIPQLQPTTFRLPVRYLAHPRLSQIAKAMGFALVPEKHINHWPQPFG